MPESGCLYSFTLLQLDVTRSLGLVLYPSDSKPRPSLRLTRNGRFAADRNRALTEFPVGTVAW